MKKLLFFLLLIGSLSILEAKPNLDEITFESLAGNGFTDHVKAFQILFEIQPIDEFLELGVGLGTKFFLDHCKHVTSIEVLVKDRSGYVIPWYFDCIDLYKNYANWSPNLYVFPTVVNQANDWAISEIDPETLNPEYLTLINKFLDSAFQHRYFDLVFVDPGMHIRGDFVNALFGRADIIVAHDTNALSRVYGWYKIRTPGDYEQIRFTYGSGVTFWVRKNRGKIIEYLQRALEGGQT